MENAYVLQLRNENLEKINFKFCGYSECEALHKFGPASRPVYIIHIVLDGEGVYVVNGKKYKLKKGQGFIIEPNIITFYQANSKNPWKYCWIAFDGEGVKKFLQELGVVQKKPIFKMEKIEELYLIVKEMLKLEKNNLIGELQLQSLFYKFFALIIETSTVEKDETNVHSNKYVNEAIEFIKKNYWDDINVNSIIDYIGLNRSYFSTLFQKVTGMTLCNYLSTFRLTRANELLDITDETIEEISINCGYRDPLVFSKAYKKKYGLTPTQHRNIDRKKCEEKLKKFKGC